MLPQDKLFASNLPASSDPLKPNESTASSGTRVMPHFQRLISNLQVRLFDVSEAYIAQVLAQLWHAVFI